MSAPRKNKLSGNQNRKRKLEKDERELKGCQRITTWCKKAKIDVSEKSDSVCEIITEHYVRSPLTENSACEITSESINCPREQDDSHIKVESIDLLDSSPRAQAEVHAPSYATNKVSQNTNVILSSNNEALLDNVSKEKKIQVIVVIMVLISCLILLNNSFLIAGHVNQMDLFLKMKIRKDFYPLTTLLKLKQVS